MHQVSGAPMMLTRILATTSVAAAFPQGRPPHRSTNAHMGPPPIDYYAAGMRYCAGDSPDVPKLERSVLNSRLNAPHDTRPELEKREARRPRCAHCAQLPAHARPSSALRAAVPALRTAQLCAHGPSSARTGALRTAVPALRTECPAPPRSQEAALHIIKEKRSQETVKYLKYAFVTYRWVKSLSVASIMLCGTITGLSRILTPARVLKTDMLSFLALI